MKSETNEDPWQYASFDGVERLQFRQTAKMSMPERLAVVDGMLAFAHSLKPAESRLAEKPPAYGTDSE